MKSFSQAGQDLFVYNILERKNNGTYLDIGCGSCTEIFIGNNSGSNSLLLHTLGWRGIGFDYQNEYKSIWERVKNDKIYISDLTNCNWQHIINENKILENTIDYLSFDIDDATILGINNFPFDKIRFRVITIEHDSYRVGDNVKNHIRNTLKNFGYDLLCSDVMVQIDGNQPWIYEDWWVDMALINKDLAEIFRCDKELGHVIAHKGDLYLEKNIKNIKIDISIGEAIDRLSILNIKKLFIEDDNKLLDINFELNQYDNIIKFIKENCVSEYKDIYLTNKIIWELSNIIRDKKDNEEYKNALIDVHSYNDKRFIIKNDINNKFNTEIKEHKSYDNISIINNTNENVIYYMSSGLLGDFLNTLYIIKNMYNNTGKKGILYMTNIYKFRFPINYTYYELLDVVLSQDYIHDFILCDVSHIDDFKDFLNKDFINLTKFYNSKLLFKFNWIDIFTQLFNLQNISFPLKWLKVNEDNKFKNKILIHSKEGECPILYNCVDKNKCIFISCNQNEYNNFPYKDKLESYFICKDLNELIIAINSCKFFIGVQSSPLAIAVALGKKCLGSLLNNGGDELHYIGIEQYNPNFYWINHTKNSANFDYIKNYIDF